MHNMIFFFINYRSGVTLAIKDNNGTFLSTLSMQLYKVRPFKTFGRLQKNFSNSVTQLLFCGTGSTVPTDLNHPRNRT